MKEFVSAIKKSKYAVVMTGAGVSTFSGIADFRGKKGIYTKENGDKIFDIEWFYKNPSIYYNAAKKYFYKSGKLKPSIIHVQLAALEKKGLLKAVITQNIDGLHHKAGSKEVLELHGSLKTHSCSKCGLKIDFDEASKIVRQSGIPYCSRCDNPLKPDIVFFGEMLPKEALTSAVEHASKADLMIVLGSSLVVYPAANLPQYTLRNGGKLVIVNNMETPLDMQAFLKFDDLGKVFTYLENQF